MKKMSKLLALILTLVMALSLVNTAFAAEGGTIVITGPDAPAGMEKRTYAVYQMFEVEVINDSQNKYKYEVLPAWANFKGTTPGYEDLSSYFEIIDGYVHWKKATTSPADGAAIAQLAKKYLDEKNTPTTTINSVASIKVNGAAGNVTKNGYYLLVPNDGSTCGVLVVVNDETVTIKEKSIAPGMPRVEKTVQEDSTNSFGSSNDVDIGQQINFQTTIYAGAGASQYILHDKMSSDMAWINDGSGFVTRDGNKLVRDTDFTVDENPSDECTFHIIFSDGICASLHEDATLVVNYYAVLNETATPGQEHPHTNETWLTHTDQQVATDHSSTNTYTYSVTVTKKDTDGNLLADAGFVLKDNVNKYYHWNETTKKVEWVSEAEADIKTTGADGTIVFLGVDAENFTVEEKVVPGGYTGAGVTPVSTKAPSTGEVTVVNTLGSALPETGGMGTTLFYVGGGLLVAAAVVLLALKKRKAE